MPNLEEHCKHSEKRYGIRGEEIHSWIDEPSQIAGGSHRDYRHDLSSLQTAIQLFSKLYGAEMVENIFLDHLKADSAENRKRNEVIKDGSTNEKLWSKEDDDYLEKIFLSKSDLEMEAVFENKTRFSIRKRRLYLGLIRPRGIRRTKNSNREQRVVFRLIKGRKFYLNLYISGGNNDIDFTITNFKGDGIGHERIVGGKKIEFIPKFTDNYSLIFGNSFSWVTGKQVNAFYHLENGREVKMRIGL